MISSILFKDVRKIKPRFESSLKSSLIISDPGPALQTIQAYIVIFLLLSVALQDSSFFGFLVTMGGSHFCKGKFLQRNILFLQTEIINKMLCLVGHF